VIVPSAPPVKVTVQTAAAGPLLLSTQLALDGETLAPLAVTLNVPVGLLFEPVFVSVTVTVHNLPVPMATAPVPQSTVVLVVLVPAAVEYGPTNGPPPGAPTGTTGSVDESSVARARFSRPFPV
jgi:hypothetical protein